MRGNRGAPTVLAATWDDGVFVITAEGRDQELAGQAVRSLAPHGHGGALAIVGGHSLCRRTADGEWTAIATSEFQLAGCVAVGDVTYVGTDDARVLRISANGRIDRIDGFDAVAGRDTWFAGSAIIDGQRVGPPLGIRSMAATADAAVLLANVHVGGIPRSTDGGVTWHPTIDIDSDVHEVCAHPTDPSIMIAAAAIGLCISRDGGATWSVEHQGLHARYCSAVGFSGDDILVSAADDHFATQAAIYRRTWDGDGPLVPVRGLPTWIDGIADTGCIATLDSVIAVADRASNLYVSADAGASWSCRASGLPTASSVLIVSRPQ